MFCQSEEFEHVKWFTSGLLLNENKTLQEMCAQQVDGDGAKVSRYPAVFEASGKHWVSETECFQLTQ